MRIKFKKNMSNLDRAIRTVVGLTLVTAGPVTGFITPDKLSSILMGIVGRWRWSRALFILYFYEFTDSGAAKSPNSLARKNNRVTP
jgi:hypothetical protein